ncbi:pentatricopeptide repeat-containing protein At5g27460 [Diospyros lotus]|uniref:pentatricopeptide repeat-containing protein At5g27460 n=1 Tax=Diospyros lotus TaxID=55363 RepID=UPI00225581D1|nr:pentatricopeptide repeat-containing protein At5g27460 [Diospyros lotus]
MAMRSFFHNLNRNVRPTIGRIWWRSISSYRQSSPPNKISRRRGLHLKDLICGLPFSRGSATTVLQNWVDEGRKVLVSELRRISRQLMSRRHYKHAFEIITWMEVHNGYSISATDHGMKLELIIKMGNLKEGEEYFANMPYVSQKAGYPILLRSCVKEKDTEKAEALMVRMSGLGLTVNPHPFNEMMKLYMATSQFGKVPSVILEMKQKNILRNVLSYNLWMGACYAVSGVASAEMVYKEMRRDKDVEVGWSTLSTLADIYLKSGFLEKAKLALQNAERKLSTTKRLGYFFLITLYASAENKDGVLRLWESSKAVEGKITSANYMCILLCLVKLGDIGEAEKVLMQYESECRKYDIRVSNVLLGAYMRNGLMEKAESLHNRTLEKGGSPNYKTWEILMEGWVRSQNMDKAIDAMKKGFALLKRCDWRPSPTIVVAIADFFQKSGNFEDAKHYLKVTRRFGLANLPVYKSLLRMHASTQQPVQEIFRMMEEDGIEIDDETSALLQPFKV